MARATTNEYRYAGSRGASVTEDTVTVTVADFMCMAEGCDASWDAPETEKQYGCPVCHVGKVLFCGWKEVEITQAARLAEIEQKYTRRVTVEYKDPITGESTCTLYFADSNNSFRASVRFTMSYDACPIKWVQVGSTTGYTEAEFQAVAERVIYNNWCAWHSKVSQAETEAGADMAAAKSISAKGGRA